MGHSSKKDFIQHKNPLNLMGREVALFTAYEDTKTKNYAMIL